VTLYVMWRSRFDTFMFRMLLKRKGTTVLSLNTGFFGVCSVNKTGVGINVLSSATVASWFSSCLAPSQAHSSGFKFLYHYGLWNLLKPGKGVAVFTNSKELEWELMLVQKGGTGHSMHSFQIESTLARSRSVVQWSHKFLILYLRCLGSNIN